MSKSDQNQLKRTTNDQINKIRAGGDVAAQGLKDQLSTSQDRASSIFPGVAAGYSDISSTGGYDPAILGRLTSQYDTLATTGGIDEAGATAMRNRSAEGVKGIYQNLSDQARRTSSATGGFGGNIGATIDKLARNSAQAQATSITGTDASIAGLRQAGTVAGLSGGTNLQQNIAGNRLSALGGSAGLYGTESANTSAALSQILQNLQQTGSLTNQDLAILYQIAQRPGPFDNILKAIQTAGGVAAGVAGGA